MNKNEWVQEAKSIFQEYGFDEKLSLSMGETLYSEAVIYECVDDNIREQVVEELSCWDDEL